MPHFLLLSTSIPLYFPIEHQFSPFPTSHQCPSFPPTEHQCPPLSPYWAPMPSPLPPY
ncbi:unnamed protein product [Staurois parvus]|uniref:Uncharacterized protein n=1 Tax=Staurois parvus TaxID=386267 RepID=A0ABN9FGM4_9NEOB|nr:unnamed protein product [Staurois parvus]